MALTELFPSSNRNEAFRGHVFVFCFAKDKVSCCSDPSPTHYEAKVTLHCLHLGSTGITGLHLCVAGEFSSLLLCNCIPPIFFSASLSDFTYSWFPPSLLAFLLRINYYQRIKCARFRPWQATLLDAFFGGDLYRSPIDGPRGLCF